MRPGAALRSERSQLRPPLNRGADFADCHASLPCPPLHAAVWLSFCTTYLLTTLLIFTIVKSTRMVTEKAAAAFRCPATFCSTRSTADSRVPPF